MRKLIASIGVRSLLLLVGILGVAGWGQDTNGGSQPAHGLQAGAQGLSSLASLPAAAQARISAALGRDVPAYRVRRARAGGAGFVAQNAKNKLAADFTADGVAVSGPAPSGAPAPPGMKGRGGALWKMALAGYGYGGYLRPVARALPRASGNRVEYRRGALMEWYVNGPLGLEQGFTLTEPPRRVELRTKDHGPGATDASPLTVALELAGDLTATVDEGGASLRLSGSDGKLELRYTGLTAYDATGRELRAWLELRGRSLLLRADDANARYPVVIDPIVQLAELTASDGASFDELGASVAISGNTVVAGASEGLAKGTGAVYVFVEPATGWANMTQTAKLTASDGKASDELGLSVAISGNTIVAGAPQAKVGGNGGQGAAYIFVEPAGGWVDMTETAKLVASDGGGAQYFGWSTTLSGNTAVIGAPSLAPGSATPGAAYVFVKPPSGWKTTARFAAKLTASDAMIDAELGESVSLSGSTAVAGAPGHRAAYIFIKPATGWVSMTQTAELTAPGQQTGDAGFSVSVSGNTVVAGAPSASFSGFDTGAAYIFVEPATGWANMTQTATLTASGAHNLQSLGGSVAVVGNVVLAGAISSDGPGGGAVDVYVEPKSGWADMTQTARITASGEQSGDYFGYSVALSGGTVVAGAVNTNAGQGAAYVFRSQ